MSFAQCFLRIFTAVCIILLLTAGTVITFRHVVFSDIDELDGMYDVYRYFAPITFFLDHCIHTGELPLWNPVTYCGMPVTGNPQSFLFYAPHLIRSLLTRPESARMVGNIGRNVVIKNQGAVARTLSRIETFL